MPSVFFSYDAAEEAVEERLGSKLAAYGLSAKVVFRHWLLSSERDTAYMAFSARPRLPLADRWEMIFPRVLHSCGIPLDDLDGLFNKDDVRHITDIYLYGLTPRPGLAEMLQTLKEGGIDFWCCSGAGVKRVKNYFARAGIDMPETQIWDTSRVGVSKPQLPVYETLVCEWQEKLPGEVMIFGASHAWDLAGAKACGFHTAYTTEYEHFECVSMWGKHDVVAPDLASLGKAIVAKFGG
ncbi:hypothetical protein EHS25_005867 [Saitozyma podzolica]|uniref:Haloacid dehalogenase, type II n=1 Tax=Saitozyma podzolica TaxID=1890683 RepID=A0A427XVP5_9TREE|nr:hypothetical protein EHS25_005867 [Saitozyma podzolica]